MRSKGKTADGIVVLRYYNVLFYLFFRAEVDDFKRQCLVNRIDAGESIRMKQSIKGVGAEEDSHKNFAQKREPSVRFLKALPDLRSAIR